MGRKTFESFGVRNYRMKMSIYRENFDRCSCNYSRCSKNYGAVAADMVDPVCYCPGDLIAKNWQPDWRIDFSDAGPMICPSNQSAAAFIVWLKRDGTH